MNKYNLFQGNRPIFDTLRPKLRMLNPKQVSNVVDEAISILDEVGITVENSEALELLHGAGTKIDKQKVFIPPDIVEKALKSAPPQIIMYDRFEKNIADLSGDNVHFDPGSAALLFLDYKKNKIRNAVSTDCYKFSRLTDKMDNIALQSTGAIPSDVPEEVADSYRLYVALQECSKPIVTGTFDIASFDVMKNMLTIIRDNEKNLCAKPLAIFDCCPSPPLKWSNLTCQNLIDAARAGIPAELVSMPLTGATSPVTLLGAVVQHCAESLSGIVIHQLANPGSPIIYGGSPAMFDMRVGTTPMGAIETLMIDSAYAQVGKYLGLPTHAYMGLSDSKCVDMQAGLESGMGIIMAALAGVNMVSGAGMMDFENCQSLEKLVIDNEICGMALRLIKGIAQRDEIIAKDIIKEVISSGKFISHPHTLKWFKKEAYYPGKVIDRTTDEQFYINGGKCAFEKAHEQVEKILSAHKPEPLEMGKLNALKYIMSRRFAQFGSKLPEIDD